MHCTRTLPHGRYSQTLETYRLLSHIVLNNPMAKIKQTITDKRNILINLREREKGFFDINLINSG